MVQTGDRRDHGGLVMYLCDYCGAAFQSLDYIEEKSDECGNSIIYVCPECGEEINP